MIFEMHFLEHKMIQVVNLYIVLMRNSNEVPMARNTIYFLHFVLKSTFVKEFQTPDINPTELFPVVRFTMLFWNSLDPKNWILEIF